MARVLVVSSGMVPSFDSVEVVSVPAYPARIETSGISAKLKAAKRRRAVDAIAASIAKAIARVKPDVVVFADQDALEYVDESVHSKIIAVCTPKRTKLGEISNPSRYRWKYGNLETTIVFDSRDKDDLCLAGLFNVRCIDGSPASWDEEIRQALR